jgi:hypothetical protein
MFRKVEPTPGDPDGPRPLALDRTAMLTVHARRLAQHDWGRGGECLYAAVPGRCGRKRLNDAKSGSGVTPELPKDLSLANLGEGRSPKIVSGNLKVKLAYLTGSQTHTASLWDRRLRVSDLNLRKR